MKLNIVPVIAVSLLFPVLSHAQFLKFGVVGGVSLTDNISTSGFFTNESRFYSVGPSVEFQFTDRFSAEFDALYKRVGRSAFLPPTTTSPNASFNVRERGNSWEFPLIGKYYLFDSDRRVRPYVGTGWSFRKIWVDSETTTTTGLDGTPTTQLSASSYTSGTGVGAVFVGGVRWDKGRLAFTPEFRYTRWGGSEEIGTVRNQAEFLLGIRF